MKAKMMKAVVAALAAASMMTAMGCGTGAYKRAYARVCNSMFCDVGTVKMHIIPDDHGGYYMVEPVDTKDLSPVQK